MSFSYEFAVEYRGSKEALKAFKTFLTLLDIHNQIIVFGENEYEMNDDEYERSVRSLELFYGDSHTVKNTIEEAGLPFSFDASDFGKKPPKEYFGFRVSNKVRKDTYFFSKEFEIDGRDEEEISDYFGTTLVVMPDKWLEIYNLLQIDCIFPKGMDYFYIIRGSDNYGSGLCIMCKAGSNKQSAIWVNGYYSSFLSCGLIDMSIYREDLLGRVAEAYHKEWNLEPSDKQGRAEAKKSVREAEKMVKKADKYFKILTKIFNEEAYFVYEDTIEDDAYKSYVINDKTLSEALKFIININDAPYFSGSFDISEIKLINLDGCTELTKLPKEICKFTGLKTLILTDCDESLVSEAEDLPLESLEDIIY